MGKKEMRSLSKRTSCEASTSRKRKSLPDNSKMSSALKRKSVLLQYSISLNIPPEEVSKCANCYINLPEQVFSLTYLEVNDTQNREFEPLNMLEDFREGKWYAYLAGFMYNFSYQPAQRKALERALNSAFRMKFENSKIEMTYRSQVSVCDYLSPTENDNEALQVIVLGKSDDQEQLLYNGYLLSWCSPVRESHPLLPILLSQGKVTYRKLVHSVISEKFDIGITRLLLTQQEFLNLTTYCLVMLDQNDGYQACFSYKIPSGNINLTVHVEHLLALWKKIHREEGTNIDLDDMIVFHKALDNFYETNFGIKLGCAHFENVTVNKCFGLHNNSQMWFKSKRIIHVVLKYLNHLAVQRLRMKALNSYLDDADINTADNSEIIH